MQNVEQNFNPGLALIGHSGTGPRCSDGGERGEEYCFNQP